MISPVLAGEYSVKYRVWTKRRQEKIFDGLLDADVIYVVYHIFPIYIHLFGDFDTESKVLSPRTQCMQWPRPGFTPALLDPESRERANREAT